MERAVTGGVDAGQVATGSPERRGPERSEGTRSGGDPVSHGHQEGGRPRTEVLARPVRRKFPTEYRRRIVEEAEKCTKPGEIGALLRREGLFSSHLSKWREQYRRGQLSEGRRGRKTTRQPSDMVVDKLQRENASLRQRLERAEAIIDIQKKICGMLGLAQESQS